MVRAWKELVFRVSLQRKKGEEKVALCPLTPRLNDKHRSSTLGYVFEDSSRSKNSRFRLPFLSPNDQSNQRICSRLSKKEFLE